MTEAFSDIIGQDYLKASLLKEQKKGRLAHAYLFEGLAGTGRVTFARALAKRTLCEQANACGKCRSCVQFNAGTHPDYMELSREGANLPIARFVADRGDSSNSGYDTPLISFLQKKPSYEHGSVVLIPDAERMMVASANALLKTLEEPPASALILLTTIAKDRLPATVCSRCRKVGIAPLSDELIQRELLRRGVLDNTEEALASARMSGGSLGLALTLSSSESREAWRWLDGALSQKGARSAIMLAKGWIDRSKEGELGNRRQAAVRILDLSALWLRLQLKTGMDPLSVHTAYEVLQRAAVQISQNIRIELALTSAAGDCMAALSNRRG